jgi:hypothetical protein
VPQEIRKYQRKECTNVITSILRTRFHTYVSNGCLVLEIEVKATAYWLTSIKLSYILQQYYFNKWSFFCTPRSYYITVHHLSVVSAAPAFPSWCVRIELESTAMGRPPVA